MYAEEKELYVRAIPIMQEAGMKKEKKQSRSGVAFPQ